MTPAAFAYAGACVIVLLLFPHLREPLHTYGAASVGAILLGRDALQGVLWGTAAGAGIALLGQAFAHWTSWGKLFSRLTDQLFGDLHPIDAVLLAALSGFCEELVFRGLALPYLGLYASSALFGLLHVIPRRGLWPLGLWAGANGIVLGWMALRTGGLLAPIAAHFVVNAVGLLILAGRTRESEAS